MLARPERRRAPPPGLPLLPSTRPRRARRPPPGGWAGPPREGLRDHRCRRCTCPLIDPAPARGIGPAERPRFPQGKYDLHSNGNLLPLGEVASILPLPALQGTLYDSVRRTSGGLSSRMFQHFVALFRDVQIGTCRKSATGVVGPDGRNDGGIGAGAFRALDARETVAPHGAIPERERFQISRIAAGAQPAGGVHKERTPPDLLAGVWQRARWTAARRRWGGGGTRERGWRRLPGRRWAC